MRCDAAPFHSQCFIARVTVILPQILPPTFIEILGIVEEKLSESILFYLHMKRLLNKLIDFFDYYFYKATKTMIFDKEIDVKMFGGRCVLCLLLYLLVGFILWPLLGLFADILSDKHIEIILPALTILLLLFTHKRYSDITLFNKLQKRYNNEHKPVIKGLLVLIFTAIIATIHLLLMKYCFIVPHHRFSAI